MRVSYNWLKDYVDIELPAKDIAERLTLSGLEVEELIDRYEYLEKVVVARVVQVEDHPKTPHIKICQVEAPGETFQVVCGAPNVRPGMLSALAMVGATLPNGATVGDVEIRGVRSSGMLCSEAELEVGLDASTIMEFPDGARLGENLRRYLDLNDWIMVFGITPNRPDCLSVLGVAREIAGLTNKKLKLPPMGIQEGPDNIEDLTSIEVLATGHCPRYSARVIRDIKIGPSPFWMVERLRAAGVRSINNVVDITNYVMLEYGQPLHAFDMDELDEQRIVVKLASEGQRFTTLDNTERIMTPDMLMICDGSKAVGLAGVMGGLNSEIQDSTKNVLLESAYFDAACTRRTSKTLGLSTEASYRFERGVDPEGCVAANDRAIGLMAELAGGVVARGVLDTHPEPFEKPEIDFSPAKCNRFLGSDFTPEMMVEKLRNIELEVMGGDDAYTIIPPNFRFDLTREVDIFEEVARLIGFDRIKATLPQNIAEPEPISPSLLLRRKARQILEGSGLTEVVNYSFITENFADRLILPENDFRRKVVRILNPLSEDQAVMRTTMIPGLLDTLRRNQAYNVTDVHIYEIGICFFPGPDRELPDERLFLGGVLSGRRNEVSWHHNPELVDFYDVKGLVEDLVEGLRLPEPVFKRAQAPAYYNPEKTALFSAQGCDLGWLGEIRPEVAKAWDLRETAYIFELDLMAMLEVQKGTPKFTTISRFPAVGRDLAVVLDREVEASSIIDLIKGLEQEFLTDLFLFDKYEGKQVGPGKKSLAFRLMYQSFSRTLTDDEVNDIHEKVTQKVLTAFSAVLPG
jgi:phenylalanyl-tRNA synthetase beta chain